MFGGCGGGGQRERKRKFREVGTKIGRNAEDCHLFPTPFCRIETYSLVLDGFSCPAKNVYFFSNEIFFSTRNLSHSAILSPCRRDYATGHTDTKNFSDLQSKHLLKFRQ